MQKTFVLLILFVLNTFADTLTLDKLADLYSLYLKKNIIISQNLVDQNLTVTISAYDKTAQNYQTFKQIIENNDLQIQKIRNNIIIKKKQNENIRSYKYKLDDATFAKLFKQIFTNVQFVANNHTLIVTADPEIQQQIRIFLKSLNDNYLAQQINIYILETDIKKLFDLGTQINFQKLSNTPSYYIQTMLSKTFQTLPVDFNIFINALIDNSISRYIQKPQFTVVDGHNYHFKIAETVPIKISTITNEDSRTQTQDQIEYRDVGLSIDIKNVYLTNENISFEYQISISNIIDRSLTPTFKKRLIESFRQLPRSHNAYILTTFTAEQITKHKYSIPIIENIPYLGDILTYKSNHKNSILYSVILEVI